MMVGEGTEPGRVDATSRSVCVCVCWGTAPNLTEACAAAAAPRAADRGRRRTPESRGISEGAGISSV